MTGCGKVLLETGSANADFNLVFRTAHFCLLFLFPPLLSNLSPQSLTRRGRSVAPLKDGRYSPSTLYLLLYMQCSSAASGLHQW